MTMTAAAPTITAVVGSVHAEHDEELFDTYDEAGHPMGTELRAVVHARGIWHHAVYVFVFNSQGQLLMQQRAAGKKVFPGRWDLSVAEHLSPGEAFDAGAKRGLTEELGITLPPATPTHPATSSSWDSERQQGTAAGTWLSGPLAPCHQRRLDLPAIGVKDYEFVEAYRLDGWDGPVAFNQNEVSEVAWVSLEDLRKRMAENPDAFTPWFRGETALLGWV